MCSRRGIRWCAPSSVSRYAQLGVRQKLHTSLQRNQGHDLARLALFKELFAIPIFPEAMDDGVFLNVQMFEKAACPVHGAAVERCARAAAARWL